MQPANAGGVLHHARGTLPGVVKIGKSNLGGARGKIAANRAGGNMTAW
jgi:hypothetical protein